MPFRRRKKKSDRKRVVRRKRFRKRRPRLPVGGFPKRMLAKLRYVQNVTLNAGAGTYAVNLFSANSLYDPDATGTGHQPSNYDRLCAIYDRYTVLGARCTASVNPSTSSALAPGIMVVALSEAGDTISIAHAAGGIANVLEQPMLAHTYKNIGAISNGVVKVSRNFSAKKFHGIKGSMVGLSPYTSDIANNPTERVYFEVAIVSNDDSTDPGNYTVLVEIEYVAMFTELKYADSS